MCSYLTIFHSLVKPLAGFLPLGRAGCTKRDFALNCPKWESQKIQGFRGEVCLNPTSLAHQKNKALSGLWEVCLPPNFPFPGLTNSFAFTDLLLVADGKVDVPKTTFVKMNSSFEIKVKTNYEIFILNRCLVALSIV